MVADPERCHALSGNARDQRFNVAASRARDRMYPVRPVRFVIQSDFASLQQPASPRPRSYAKPPPNDYAAADAMRKRHRFARKHVISLGNTTNNVRRGGKGAFPTAFINEN